MKARRATGARTARFSKGLRRDAAPRRLPHDAPVAQARRQGNPAQESEPDLLSDQRRRPRSDPRRRRASRSSRATTGSSRTIAIARCACSSASRRSRCCSRRSAPKDDPELAAAARCRRTGATPACNIVSGSSPTGTQVLHAVGAAEAGVIYSRVAADSRSRVALPRRRDHLRLARRGRDERRRVLGSAQHRVHQAPAGAVPRRGQRLRDLGAGRSADAGRRHLAARAIVSRAPRRFDRRHRFLRQPARDARRRPTTSARARGRRSSTRASSARTRTRCPTTRSCTRRRRSAKPKRAAIRSRGSPSS